MLNYGLFYSSGRNSQKFHYVYFEQGRELPALRRALRSQTARSASPDVEFCFRRRCHASSCFRNPESEGVSDLLSIIFFIVLIFFLFPIRSEVDYPTQPPMMSFKHFLSTQDDNITDEESFKRYNEYKLEFKKEQIKEFFLQHKEEEWYAIIAICRK